MIDAGVNPIDAQQRVDWVLTNMPAHEDPSTWIPTGDDLNEPIDDAATDDAAVAWIASDAVAPRWKLLLSAQEEDEE